MHLLANGRLTDLGALLATVVFTVAIVSAVFARAYRTEPERLSWPTSWATAWERVRW